MPSIGTLYGTLKLNSEQYQRGIGQASVANRRFSRELDSMTRGPGFARLTRLFSAVIIANQVKGLIDYGSALTDAAEQARIGVEELQVLQDAARDAGVKVEILERALRNVTLRGEEAALGNESYARALRALNLEVDAFNTLPTERKLEAIGKAYVESGKSAQSYAAVARILGEEAGPKLIEVLRRLGVDGFDKLNQDVQESGRVLSDYNTTILDGMGDDIGKVGTMLKTFGAGIVATLWAPLAEALIDTSEATGKLELANLRILRIEGQLADGANRSEKEWQELTERLEELKEVREQLHNQVSVDIGDIGGEALREVPEKLAKFLEKAKSPIQRAMDLTFEIGQMLDKYEDLLTVEERQRAVDFLNANYQAALKAEESVNDLNDAAKDLGLTFSFAFEEAIIGGEKFREVVKGLAKDILGLFVRQTLTEPLANSIAGLFGGSDGGFLAKLFGRAAGGPVSPTQAYMVGEEGPEMFVPARSGVILPNGTSFGGGGTTINQVINVSTGVAATVRAEIVSMLPTIQRVTVSGVEEARVRRRSR